MQWDGFDCCEYGYPSTPQYGSRRRGKIRAKPHFAGFIVGLFAHPVGGRHDSSGEKGRQEVAGGGRGQK